MDLLFEFCKQFGPLAGAVLFFVWRDWKREQRLTKSIDDIQKEFRKTLITTVEESTRVIERNTVIMERNIVVMDRITERLINNAN